MASYIQNPISHKEWNPEMGDYYSERIFKEDKLHEQKITRKKLMVGGLISMHIIMLTLIFLMF